MKRIIFLVFSLCVIGAIVLLNAGDTETFIPKPLCIFLICGFIGGALWSGYKMLIENEE